MKNYLNLFLAFFRCGVFGFGGGQATIPLVQEEVVETFKWLNIEEFTDVLAFGNSLPGPITTKMAALVGYKVAGVMGVIISLLGLILPSALAIILLLNIYLKYKTAPWLKGMMKGVRPVVVALIFSVALNMGRKSLINLQTIIISIISGFIILKFNIHPVYLILAGLIYGGIFLV